MEKLRGKKVERRGRKSLVTIKNFVIRQYLSSSLLVVQNIAVYFVRFSFKRS